MTVLAVGTAALGTVAGASPAHAATPPCYSPSQPVPGLDPSRLDIRGCSAISSTPNQHRAYATLLSSPNSTTASSCTIDIIAIRNSDNTILENNRGQDCTAALRKGTSFAYYAGTHPLTGGLRVDAGITLRFSNGGTVRYYSSDPDGGSSTPPPSQAPSAHPPNSQAPSARSTPPPKPQPSQSECKRIKEDQPMDVTFRARFERYTFDKTMVPSREFDRRPDLVWRIGKLHAEGTTCLHSGTWRILAPMHITGSSEGLDGAGKGIGMGRAKTIRWWGAMQPDWGWGIGRKDSKGPLVAKKPYVEVVQMECVRGMLWSTLEDVLSLVPMPNWTFDLGKTVATKFLPKDRMQCRDYGTDRVSFWARNDGTIATGIASQRWNPLYEETERPPPDHAAIGFGARGLIDVQRLGTEANVE